jgi:hypothetical protein
MISDQAKAILRALKKGRLIRRGRGTKILYNHNFKNGFPKWEK